MNTTRLSRRAVVTAGVATTVVGLGSGAAWALDRYIIDHVEITNASQYGSTTEPSATTKALSANGQLSDDGYTSDAVQIEISAHTSGSGSAALAWYVADVQLSDATLLRTAFAHDTYGTNVIDNPSVIADQFGALLAINGDYYGFRETGIVIRNGVAFRDAGARQGLLLSRDGTMTLYDETATSADQLVADGAWQTWSFGPGLVNDGAVLSGIDSVEVDTNVGNHSIQGNQPRTAIGMIEPNHFVLIAVDGRSSGYSSGLTLPGLAGLAQELGCQVAYNLDGGGSTTMVFNDALVNNPLGKGKERGTSDIIYVGK